MSELKKIWEEKREDSCSSILEAAIVCFAKDGYAKTSIKDIAAASGVSHGLVGKYFDTKDLLLAEAYRHATMQSYPIPDGNPNLHRWMEILISQTLEILKTKPVYFDFFKKLIYTADLPEIFTNSRRELFNTAPISEAFENWIEMRGIKEGTAYDYFLLFMRTEYTLLDFYRQLSHLNDNDNLNASVMLSYIVRAIEEDINTK